MPQQVAQAQGINEVLWACGTIGGHLQTEAEGTGRVEFGVEHERPQVDRDIAVGAVPGKRPALAGQEQEGINQMLRDMILGPANEVLNQMTLSDLINLINNSGGSGGSSEPPKRWC